ncbi:DNA-directed RNA polymerase II subunit RPB1 [Aspergillus pseudoviridinutans]|uniref:DNA-directed RNA polymerase II subunit RPB1 n=1 Tax=Aspergillus pseudoviridinutans TaxID=1517512 RepID=A0A9P3BG59_9EURO|nr:DNA-directed RNA polymerase II subunit RPB1 [Aspergillus pseudoviridinutans]GIJ89554.1 DNA-directed RNA polymerase II subunit RPB1 [Aspergillus pseudoviridinutans]
MKDVHQTARDIEKALAKNGLLRNMRRINPFLEGLDRYSKAVYVLCDGTPYLPWIWIALEHIDAMEKLIATYAKIAEVLPRFDRLSVGFQNNSDFHRVLALIYVDIMDLHLETYCFFHQKSWKILFHNLWDRFERRLKLILENFAEDCELLDKEAKTTVILQATDRRRKMLEEWTKSEEDRSMSQLQAVYNWLQVKDWEQEDELDRLHSLQHKDSCDWIFQNHKTRSWIRTGSEESVVWLTGKPGAGKSVLSATIVYFLKLEDRSKVLYYFCGYQSFQNQTKAHPLRSLLAQFVRCNPECASYIYHEYLQKGHGPSIAQLRRLLQFTLTTISSVRIIIDGVDELPDREQEQILSNILPLATSRNPAAVCKILISSRDTVLIAARMSKRSTVNLSRERPAIDAAIESFISHELTFLRKSLEDMDIDDDTMKDIKNELIEKADAHSLAELRDTVRLLPKGVEKIYEKVVRNSLENASDTNRNVMLRILSWIIYGIKPLRKFEIISGASIHARNVDFSEQYRLRDGALELCKPLLEEGRNETVRFIHFTVREYFVHGGGARFLRPIQAHFNISFACLAYLTKGMDLLDPDIDSEQNVSEVARGFHGLCWYAHEHWLYHLLACLDEPESITADESALILRQADEFYRKDSRLQTRHSQVQLAEPSHIPKISLDGFHCPLLADSPDLADFIQNSCMFRKTVKDQQFSSANDIDQFKLQQDPTLLSLMVQIYSQIVQSLCTSTQTPGVSQRQLAKFKEQFSLSAFMCRFFGCRNAFASVKELEDHELSRHTCGIRCIEQSCCFSRIGFPTSKALKAHINIHHRNRGTVAKPTSIRRKYQCDGCVQRFSLEKELIRHQESQEGTQCGIHMHRASRQDASTDLEDDPKSPIYTSTSPRCSPISPLGDIYGDSIVPSPTFTPVSPKWYLSSEDFSEQAPTGPGYDSASPEYSPASPGCSPASPEYSPASPTYFPPSP